MEKKEAFLHGLPLRMLLFLYQSQNYSCKQGKTLEMEVKSYVRILNRQQQGQQVLEFAVLGVAAFIYLFIF